MQYVVEVTITIQKHLIVSGANEEAVTDYLDEEGLASMDISPDDAVCSTFDIIDEVDDDTEVDLDAYL